MDNCTLPYTVAQCSGQREDTVLEPSTGVRSHHGNTHPSSYGTKQYFYVSSSFPGKMEIIILPLIDARKEHGSA